ncbi:hypothetical protein Rsub_08233 [Raphidocelis subcapitata]|uniref:N-acetyltransferase domain-containing protein n=1 Tax=Raphidocelis subcapitata TaxID=307507 RepID=A0A2V0PF30_9CHLO|nr:hypothetical protein Rsub_08233 [Raphidocelis subcapitata]|eukprot:GBF95797.1 hypothetical protein Rsub_08233 [Raphidocelis subcapitata]
MLAQSSSAQAPRQHAPRYAPPCARPACAPRPAPRRPRVGARPAPVARATAAASSSLGEAAPPLQQQQQQQQLSPVAPPLEPPACDAADAADAADASPLAVTVRPASGLLELRQVARLRAEAYYADDRSRFAESFKRQFASQEVDSLQQRTAPRGGRAQQCDCLVAVDAGGAVVGCIDVRVPQAATGLPASGVPQGEARGAYILNVVVDVPVRGRGVGRRLMRAAMARAVRVWGAERLFTHVEADNDVASALYRGCGFEQHSGSGAFEGAAQLGRLVLLVAEGSEVDAAGDGSSGGDGAAPAA